MESANNALGFDESAEVSPEEYCDELFSTDETTPAQEAQSNSDEELRKKAEMYFTLFNQVTMTIESLEQVRKEISDEIAQLKAIQMSCENEITSD